MAKTPSITDLIQNPGLVTKLTVPQLLELNKQLLELRKNSSSGDKAGPSPLDLALKLSRGKWQSAPHLELINQKVLAMERGENKRLIVSMPPRHGKSQLLSIWTPLWLLAKNPQRRLILSSYEADFAANWGRKVRDLVSEHAEELSLKPNPKMWSSNHWELQSGGTMWTAGVGGAISGKDADTFILDDPIKNSEDAASKIMREKIWDWFQTTAYSRLEPNGFIILIGTRWHEDDLLGRLEAASNSGDGPYWESLKLPALAEKDDPLGRLEGEALWPERYSREQLLEIKHGNSPYNWSALYQQSPSPEEGGGVRRTWWKRYNEAPEMDDFDDVIQSWDLAFKNLSSSDFCVGQVWGRKGAMFFLLDQIRARMDTPQIITKIRGFTQKYPRATAKLIEDAANGPAVIQMLQHEVAGLIPIKTGNQSKSQRLSAVVPLIAAGNCYLPEKPWVGDFIQECAAFPNGTYDDQVDCMSQALRYLQPKGWTGMNKDWNEAMEGKAYTSNEEIFSNQFSRWVKKVNAKAEKRINQEADRDFGRFSGPSSNSW